MVNAIVLAGGTGIRMGLQGLPKQFLRLNGKPIICYTLEIFENCEEVDRIIIPCNVDWVDYMKKLVEEYNFKKVKAVIPGGSDRPSSQKKGLDAIVGGTDDDIVLIHDGVRPLVTERTVIENIKTARKYGNAMTVKKNIETVVCTGSMEADFDDFKNRDFTYTLTAPQTFRVNELKDMLYKAEEAGEAVSKLPDASLIYAKLGKKVHLVVEEGLNLKITTPEDYYYLKAHLEMKENKQIFGL